VIRRRPIVTLTTDVGPVYAAQMKAVLARSIPPSQIVELASDLPTHAVVEGAFLLDHMARRFPAGTVHLAVVDPGVGSSRAAIAIRCADGSGLVGPDNGLLIPLARELGGVLECRRIDPKRLGWPPSSSTFEGRDLFAPTAAWLARGHALSTLGPRHRPYALRAPKRREGEGTVIHIDRFGNAITDVVAGSTSPRTSTVRLRIASRRTVRLARVRTYAELRGRQLGVLVSSFGTLELAVREGRASDRLRLATGTGVRFLAERATRRARRVDRK
jgi:S-adenosyl-L-methionine hydrolase (adenosine-forming)